MTDPILTKGAQTRQRVMEEALILFAERGVDATSLKDIAAQVGVSEPALYRHFASKGELVWRLFVDGYCGMGEELDAVQAAEPTLRGKIDRMITAYCHLYDSNQPLFRFLFLTQHGQLEKVTDDMPNPVEVVQRVITLGMQAGEIPEQDASLATALFFGVATQPGVFKIYERLAESMTHYAPALCDAAWAVLTSKESK